MSAQETAQAWVDALNDGDYERACALSDLDKPVVIGDAYDCEEILADKPFGEELEIEGLYLNRSGEGGATFALSSAQDRKRSRPGWTAYAPREGFVIEREDDEYRIHFEVSLIR